ncbi:MAG: DPP IV N-terminal domain-containing protein, partial [Candidatus Eisenbacteria bacterium]
MRVFGRLVAVAVALLMAGAVAPAIAPNAAPAPVPRSEPAPWPGGPENAERAPADTFLAQLAATGRFRLGKPNSIALTPDGKAVLFLRSGPRSVVQDLYEYDVPSQKERVLLTAAGILRGAEERLTVEERARRERQRQSARGIVSYQLSRDGRRILVPLSGRLFVVERATGAVRELTGASGFPIDPRFSPDAAQVACVRDHDLYVTDVATGEEHRLTEGGGGDITNGEAA